MHFIVFLVTFACGVYCNENLPSQPLLQPKDKRGINGHSVTFPSSSSYSTPIHSRLSSNYELDGSSSGFSLKHAGLLNSGSSISHRIGYPLTSSSGLSLGSGYQSPGLSHGSLNHQSASLGGYSSQSTYSVPRITNLGSSGSNNGLFTPSKTGPVTFGLHGGGNSAASTSGSNSYSAPISGGHGLSAYSNGGPSSTGLQIVFGSQHGLQSLGSSDTSSSYSLPVSSAFSSPSHSVTGGLIIASGSHGGSPSYSLPTSDSSRGIAALGSSSGVHGSTYTLPISSGSHGISASSAGSSGLASSGSYGSSGSTHSGLSAVSSGGSSYELPITAASHSNSGSSNAISYMNFVPSHSSSSSSSYSSPSVSYANPSINHVSSPGYSGGGASYSLSSNYVGSTSNPIVAYAGSHGYTPMYYSSSSSHGTPVDSHGAYTSVSPRYLGYVPKTKFYNVDSSNAKYDTISYSVSNGKY